MNNLIFEGHTINTLEQILDNETIITTSSAKVGKISIKNSSVLLNMVLLILQHF